jgi:drug/metabolite transporter (DMT)-like permease
MTAGVFLAVMGAAFLHAAWNALVKVGGSRLQAMLILTIVQGGIGAAVAATRPLPAGEVWPWLAASGLFHSAYKFFLAYAYEHGDLSRVYPIARGAAPLIVLGVGAVLLSDVLGSHELAGIVVLGLGILTMAAGSLRAGESRRLVPYALGSACATAGYSLVDGLGARVSGDATAYVAWLFVFDVLFFSAFTRAFRGTAPFRADRRTWARGSAASVASYAAYAIAVWAMTVAPIALVSALRETSILFAVLIGWVLFGERMDRTKALAAALIVGGVMLTRL